MTFMTHAEFALFLSSFEDDEFELVCCKDDEWCHIQQTFEKFVMEEPSEADPDRPFFADERSLKTETHS